jgi:hypothetical protein
VHQPTPSQFLAEYGTEQRAPSEPSYRCRPSPAHPALVEEEALNTTLMGEEFVGAPMVLVGGLKLRSVFVDPYDEGVPELSRRGSAEIFSVHSHRSMLIAHPSIARVRSTAQLVSAGSCESAYYYAERIISFSYTRGRSWTGDNCKAASSMPTTTSTSRRRP